MPPVLGFTIDEDAFAAELGSPQYKRAFGRVTKEIHRRMARHWYKKMLDRHFVPNARLHYNYPERSDKYIKAKANRWFGGNVEKARAYDLFWTGEFRRELRKWAVVKPYPSRFSVTMLGPRYVTMKPKPGNRKAVGEEVTRLNDRDTRELMELAEAAMPELIAAEHNRRGRKRTTIT